ncbi:MAG: hypothetical protein IKQ18_01655 [Clostridia bacterium]|nr:hypothetical protein [Clostridia bacterium]
MGFGIIFIGYLFTVFDTGFIVNEALLVFVCKILTVIGYTVLIFGLSKFSKYSTFAKYSYYGAFALDAAMIFEAVIQGLWFFKIMDEKTMVGIRFYSFTVIAVLFALVHILLMYAVFDMGRQTECEKVRKRGVRSVAATAAFCIMNIAASLPVNLGDIFAIIRYGLFIVLIILNATTLYTAYKYICLDTELEAEQAEALKERTFRSDKRVKK